MPTEIIPNVTCADDRGARARAAADVARADLPAAIRRVMRAGAHRAPNRGERSQRAKDALGLNIDYRLAVDLPRGLGKAIEAAHAVYAARLQHTMPPNTPLHLRVKERLLALYCNEIRRRGGETAIMAGEKASALRAVELGLEQREGGLALLRCDGWRYYSRRYGSRPATLAYLCGRDDNGPWAVRIAGSCTSIAEALAWVTPGLVKEATDKGLRVLRQGDVYAVEMRRGDRAGLDPLPSSHHWDPASRTLRHAPEDGRQHRPLHVPFGARFVRQRVYEPGRSTRRVYGD